MLPFAALCLSLAACDGDLAAWLERAGSGDWAERERAQRWLATHLETPDAGLLAARASSGDAELCARLARAIGGQARLVELAAKLALYAEPAAAELGREALREQILDFDPGAEDGQGEELDWLAELRLRQPELLGLSAGLRAGPLEGLLDVVARHVSGAVPLVVDPRVHAPRGSGEGSEFAGTLAELLLQCASDRGLHVRSFGFGPEESSRPWILFAPAEAGSATAAELCVSWILAAADPARSGAERAAGARALAATGWPAALDFLERRWIGGDESALDGVLLAAGRGRVAPALQDPARQRALFGELAGLARNEHDGVALARASAIARALAAAGPLSRAGEPLGPLALEGFEHATPRERWLRLVVLEGQGRLFPEALAAADAVLSAPASPAPLAIEALRLRAALVGAAPFPHAPADPLALLDWASDEARRAELRGLWTGLALDWPAPWSALQGRGSALPTEARGLLLELAWKSGAREPALAFARELFVDRSGRSFDTLCAALADLAARAVLEGLPSGSESEASHACAAALLAGLAPSAAQESRITRWLATGPQSGEELLALASQAAGTRGAEVRAKLVELLGSGFGLDERAAALERAARELAQQGQTTELENFATAVRGRARSLPQPELRARLRPGRWPQPLRGPARPLERDERELERW